MSSGACRDLACRLPRARAKAVSEGKGQAEVRGQRAAPACQMCVRLER